MPGSQSRNETGRIASGCTVVQHFRVTDGMGLSPRP
jgi:hypothetical protein